MIAPNKTKPLLAVILTAILSTTILAAAFTGSAADADPPLADHILEWNDLKDAAALTAYPTQIYMPDMVPYEMGDTFILNMGDSVVENPRCFSLAYDNILSTNHFFIDEPFRFSAANNAFYGTAAQMHSAANIYITFDIADVFYQLRFNFDSITINLDDIAEEGDEYTISEIGSYQVTVISPNPVHWAVSSWPTSVFWGLSYNSPQGEINESVTVTTDNTDTLQILTINFIRQDIPVFDPFGELVEPEDLEDATGYDWKLIGIVLFIGIVIGAAIVALAKE